MDNPAATMLACGVFDGGPTLGDLGDLEAKDWFFILIALVAIFGGAFGICAYFQ